MYIFVVEKDYFLEYFCLNDQIEIFLIRIIIFFGFLFKNKEPYFICFLLSEAHLKKNVKKHFGI